MHAPPSQNRRTEERRLQPLGRGGCSRAFCCGCTGSPRTRPCERAACRPRSGPASAGCGSKRCCSLAACSRRMVSLGKTSWKRLVASASTPRASLRLRLCLRRLRLRLRLRLFLRRPTASRGARRGAATASTAIESRSMTSHAIRRSEAAGRATANASLRASISTSTVTIFVASAAGNRGLCVRAVWTLRAAWCR